MSLRARVGESRTRLIVLLMLLVSVPTALISVKGAHASSLLLLTGTPVNVTVSDAAA